MAKSPLKEKALPSTAPRLELQATVITTRMKTHIIQYSEIQPNNIYLWSDSKVVLNYIKNVDTNFGSYIAHRVNEIQSNTDIKQWNFILSSVNDADDATKCIDVAKLQSDHWWFLGPDSYITKVVPLIAKAQNMRLMQKINNFEYWQYMGKLKYCKAI